MIMRSFILLPCLLGLVLAAPASAQHQWDGAQAGTFSVAITVMGYTQVVWQDTDIVFAYNDYTNLTGDYRRALAGTERGLYVALDGSGDNDNKASGDAWTEAFYESRDGAHLWLDTNTDILMTVTAGGDLTSGGDTIPTWFTLAGSGLAGGFLRGGLYVNDGNIPGDGAGGYAADDSGPDDIMELGSTAFHPNQYPFPMTGAGPWTLDLDGHSKGNLKWLARCERHGMDDPAGTYLTTIDVGFALNP